MRRLILLLAAVIATALSAKPVKGNLGGEGTKYSGAKGNSPTDYIQDGLIAMWDGEYNAIDADGKPCHDAKATIWTPLKGDWVLTLYPNGVWGAKSLNGDGSYRMALGVVSPPLQSLEVCFKTESSSVQFAYMHLARRNCIGVSNTDVGVGLRQGKSLGYSAVGQLLTVSAIYGGTNEVDNVAAIAYANGVELTKPGTTGANWSAPTGRNIILGGAYAEGDRCFNGSIYCIRMYNRELTAAEVSHNLKIDQERFK